MFESIESATARNESAESSPSQDETLEVLRRRMDKITGKVGRQAPATTRAHDVIAIPGALGELMPDGGLTRGTVVACPASSVVCAIVAAASSAGLNAAILCETGRPQLGLLSMWEMGADLARIARITPTTDQAGEIASILADGGVPLVVLDMPGARLFRAQVEVLRGKLRNSGTVLLVTGGEWARQPHLGIAILGRERSTGLGEGKGRVQRLGFQLEVRTQGKLFRRGRVACVGAPDHRMRWVRGDGAVTTPGLARTG